MFCNFLPCLLVILQRYPNTQLTTFPGAHTTALGEEDFPNGVLENKLMAEFE